MQILVKTFMSSGIFPSQTRLKKMQECRCARRVFGVYDALGPDFEGSAFFPRFLMQEAQLHMPLQAAQINIL